MRLISWRHVLFWCIWYGLCSSKSESEQWVWRVNIETCFQLNRRAGVQDAQTEHSKDSVTRVNNTWHLSAGLTDWHFLCQISDIWPCAKLVDLKKLICLLTFSWPYLKTVGLKISFGGSALFCLFALKMFPLKENTVLLFHFFGNTYAKCL